MRALHVTSLSGPSGVEVVEVPEPTAEEGHVVVEVKAVGVSFPDLLLSRGEYQMRPEPPFQLGVDFAGVVRTAPESTGFYPGDRVACVLPWGGAAEVVALGHDSVFPLPDNVSFEEGATLPLNSLTAYQALQLLPLTAGKRLLITGASGGVGGFATQLAVQNQLQVIAVAGRHDEDWVARLGPAEVLPRDADLARIDPVDGVFDAVPLGPERSTPALRDGGTAVFTRPPQPAESARVHFETVRVHSDPFVLALMARLLGQGELRTRVARVLPLEQAAEAHRLAEKGGLHGKVVLRMRAA